MTTYFIKQSVWYDLGAVVEFDVEIEYTITPYYPATWDDPAEGGEVEIQGAYTKDGLPYPWTDRQDAEWCDWISENHKDDGPDPDDQRDSFKEWER
jgi:hypothetical protein